MPWTDHPPLDTVVPLHVPAGTLLQRCYRLDRAPVVFWPATDVRFGAAPRATLYTGDTDTAAVGETLLRDPRPLRGTNRIVLPYDHVRQRGLATLRLLRDAVLVSLRRPAVHAVIQDPPHLDDVRELIETTRGYEETQRFARALLAQVPTLDALAWPSRRVDGHTVYCFYDGQLTAADFEVVGQVAFNTPAGVARLSAAIEAAGLIWVRADRDVEVPHDDP
jgi:hypothetical protein